MDRDAEVLDLVCGPASPLPEAHQRYRLVRHLATGGQAEVYQGVRLSGGISSAPVTVKVFRLGDHRPPADQLRSWDKGDAVLMDLNSRGVGGICRRADGFYGPPPHPSGHRPDTDSQPYQVLDYLQGVNLRDYVRRRADGAGPPRLDAAGVLATLAGVLRALHLPEQAGASPVVHMDVKPSNVMVLPSGEARLIDFTGARYHRAEHITTIAYTMEAGGPEAFSGTVGPAYDVHGFGAVAYYMVTGAFPRTDSPQGRPGPGDAPLPPWATLRRHPVLEAAPALRDHLLAPLADRPEDRPATGELPAWSARLTELVVRAATPDTGMRWAEPGGAAGTPAADDAWRRIERLEQEIVELRAHRDPRSEDERRRAETAGHRGAATPTGPVPLWPDRADQQTAGAGATGAGATRGAVAGGAAAGDAAAGFGASADRRGDAARSTPYPADAATRAAPPAADRAFSPPIDASTRAVPLSAGQAPHPASAPVSGSGHRPVSGRGAVPGRPVASTGYGATGRPGEPARHRHGHGSGSPGVPDARETRPMSTVASAPGQQRPDPAPGMRGVASVPRPQHRHDDVDDRSPREERRAPLRPLPGARLDTLRRGFGLSLLGGLFAFVCWGVWAIDNRDASFTGNVLIFLLVLVIGVGLFALCRLLGRLVIEGMMRRSRSSARLSHLAVGVYLAVCGVSFAGRVGWVHDAYFWVVSQIH